MTEDQGKPIRRDHVKAAPEAGRADDRDVRDLFRRSAPTVPSIDVEAPFSAAEARKISVRLVDAVIGVEEAL